MRPLVLSEDQCHPAAIVQQGLAPLRDRGFELKFLTDGQRWSLALLLLHAGRCYRDRPEMRGGIGGAFLSHLDQCVVTLEPKPGHRAEVWRRPVLQQLLLNVFHWTAKMN